ncbi:MAG: hypothetical protein QNJ44_22625 [Rhodobacter sp.]|nr:hypothetical protein [Rhodobacter sp.]
MAKLTVQLKIQDLDTFKDLVNALGRWAEETIAKTERSDAENELLKAAVALSDEAETDDEIDF